MTAAFFGLAGLAALNPKLLVVDLMLAGNRRPRLMLTMTSSDARPGPPANPAGHG